MDKRSKREKTKFTDIYIRNRKLKETEGKRFEEFEYTDLGLRISSAGRKTFFYSYMHQGKNRRLPIGRYPAVSLSEARNAVSEAKVMRDKGLDPAAINQAAKKQESEAKTVKMLVEDYLNKHAKIKKRSWKEDERMLLKDVVPRWGDRKAADVTKKDIIQLLDDLQARGATVTANRTLAVVRKMFNWAIERDELEYSPCSGVKPPAEENERERILSRDEIREIWCDLYDAPIHENTVMVLRIILLTAQRPGEVAGMEWSEISGRWWTIPKERTKNKRSHKVYLTDATICLLEELENDSQWVFPSPRGKACIRTMAVDHAVHRCVGHLSLDHFTPHDLRRTANSLMTENQVLSVIADKVLNHTEPKLKRTYDRYSYKKEKKEALEVLESVIKGIIKTI